MELSSSDKERIQHQYDALAKKTLVGEAKSHRRTLAKRAAREVTFSDLSESELAQLFTTDEYESDYYFRFQVSGFDVLVKNELLAEALNALPERKRDITAEAEIAVRPPPPCWPSWATPTSTNSAASIPGPMRQSREMNRGHKRHKICAAITKNTESAPPLVGTDTVPFGRYRLTSKRLRPVTYIAAAAQKT